MKSFLKKAGKSFLVLTRKNEEDLRQSVLLVDGSNILLNNFVLIIKGVKNKFKSAKLIIVTFPDKEKFLRESFPDAEIVVPGSKLRMVRHKLAIKMFLSLRKKHGFIVLSSLDISLLIIALVFGRSRVFLHNKWMEWYKIRRRNLFDILSCRRSADFNRSKKKRGLGQIVKSLGRAFLILDNLNEEELKSRVLIEDNGYTEIGHIQNAIQRAETVFINSDITVLTYPRRRQYFINRFPQIKTVTAEAKNNKYALAAQMLRIAKNKYRYIVLTTLDISPILISFLFFKARVMLYNRWHQWWSLDIRGIGGYIRPALKFLAMIPVFIYLLISAGVIFWKTAFRMKSVPCPERSFFRK